jgi:hypothetical protein
LVSCSTKLNFHKIFFLWTCCSHMMRAYLNLHNSSASECYYDRVIECFKWLHSSARSVCGPVALTYRKRLQACEIALPSVYAFALSAMAQLARSRGNKHKSSVVCGLRHKEARAISPTENFCLLLRQSKSVSHTTRSLEM